MCERTRRALQRRFPRTHCHPQQVLDVGGRPPLLLASYPLSRTFSARSPKAGIHDLVITHMSGHVSLRIFSCATYRRRTLIDEFSHCLHLQPRSFASLAIWRATRHGGGVGFSRLFTFTLICISFQHVDTFPCSTASSPALFLKAFARAHIRKLYNLSIHADME